MAVDVFDFDPHQYDVCCGSSHISFISMRLIFSEVFIFA